MPAKAAQTVTLVTSDTYGDLMRRVRHHRLLTRAEEVALAKRIERGDLKAKEYLIEHNYRLVAGIIPGYQNQGLTIEELFDEGIIGLVRAAEKFDWRKGYKFSTYATLWVRQSVQRAIENLGRTIRLPVHKGQGLRDLKKQILALAAEWGHEPSIPELAEHFGWDEEKAKDIELLLLANEAPTSLDKPVGENRETPLGDLLMDTESLGIHEEVEENYRCSRLLEVVQKLPKAEARVLELFYGLTGEKPLNLTATALRLGITTDKVKQFKSEGEARLKAEYGPELRSLFGDTVSEEEFEPALAV